MSRHHHAAQLDAVLHALSRGDHAAADAVAAMTRPSRPGRSART